MGDTEEVLREMQILQDALDAAIANENREEQAFYDRTVIEGMKRLLLFLCKARTATDGGGDW
jgi:hypothetical protein